MSLKRSPWRPTFLGFNSLLQCPDCKKQKILSTLCFVRELRLVDREERRCMRCGSSFAVPADAV